MHALTRKAGWLISLPRAEPFLYTPEVDLLHRDRHFRSPWFFYMSSQTKNFSCLNKDVLNLSIFSDDKSFHRERWKKAFRINFSFRKCLHFISLNVWYYLREIYLKRKSLIQPKKKDSMFVDISHIQGIINGCLWGRPNALILFQVNVDLTERRTAIFIGVEIMSQTRNH